MEVMKRMKRLVYPFHGKTAGVDPEGTVSSETSYRPTCKKRR